MKKKLISILILVTLNVLILHISGNIIIANSNISSVQNKLSTLDNYIEKPNNVLNDDYIIPIPLEDIFSFDSEFELINNKQNNNDLYNKTISVIADENIISMINLVDETMVLGYLKNLTSFGPRVTSTSSCDDAGNYIQSQFLKMNLQSRFDHWSMGNLEGKNVEATLEGIDPTSNQVYIICAHYDSVETSPGADDDGSGVTAVLCAAEVINKYSFRHNIRFVTFSGEEQGLIGSAFYVNNYGENTSAALNADMIGYAETEDDRGIVNIWSDSNSRNVYQLAKEISEEYNEYIGLEVLDAGYKGRSDHFRFWEYGYPAIFYQEYNFNEFYHSPEDTIEKMDITYTTRIIKLMIATLAELAEINNYPDVPSQPIGPSEGKPGIKYTFKTNTTEPDGDQVWYLWDWNDGNYSSWLGPYDSNVTCEASYIWENKDNYSIRVKAKDVYDIESNWSEPLYFSTPKMKETNTLFLEFLNNYPRFLQLIQNLLS